MLFPVLFPTVDMQHDFSIVITNMKSDMAKSEILLELISAQEMNQVTYQELSDYIRQLIQAQPTKKSRYSEQTWIYPDRIRDHVVDAFQER